ncbi:DUF4148 domain-containing protein [Burkholderia multivorans]|uniref:DUF4148 domain-containing protein n=1 Tax=Burkholderia multivorans TaxID=87883 RepID=UPI00201A1935|nr:DUF4148 domain-containing protein [Burkholderia multivorans]EKS9915427.1 DUF4148 domain-containing protein [Burkholderia multivorans]UQN72085.1 DUF4148 domain-containing protein [Burkholderia multivorans]UQN77819.1 DUF4148 domain-containing protein [Burkholderia multivorans]
MKTLIALLTTTAAVVVQSAFAQPTAPLTRAQVRDELMRLEAAGYDPSRGDDGAYPADIQAAEAKLAVQAQAHAETQRRIAASADDGVGAPARMTN